jgi:glycosyltransferase involved in cell wall biosynthesis
MVSVVYCTREHNEEHIKHIHKMFGHPKVEVIEYINEGESLTKFYKKALKETKHDIVVFLHDDIIIETKQVATKLVKLYENNPEYGVLGVAGSKYMAETGKWWENPKKMYGRVSHTHEGKTWLSAYSDDLGNAVEEVVNVDGVFFSVHKKRLKVDFDTNVKGFHFYDVDFSFRCYLSGVKVGVHTNVRINHMSIGITNDEWEQNRIEFADKFKDKLPVSIKRVIRPNEKIKVLIGCLSFANLTGSELYTFELAKELIKQNCDVTVCS